MRARPEFASPALQPWPPGRRLPSDSRPRPEPSRRNLIHQQLSTPSPLCGAGWMPQCWSGRGHGIITVPSCSQVPAVSSAVALSVAVLPSCCPAGRPSLRQRQISSGLTPSAKVQAVKKFAWPGHSYWCCYISSIGTSSQGNSSNGLHLWHEDLFGWSGSSVASSDCVDLGCWCSTARGVTKTPGTADWQEIVRKWGCPLQLCGRAPPHGGRCCCERPAK